MGDEWLFFVCAGECYIAWWSSVILSRVSEHDQVASWVRLALGDNDSETRHVRPRRDSPIMTSMSRFLPLERECSAVALYTRRAMIHS